MDTDTCLMVAPIIRGPYWAEPGTYHIRLYINFVVRPGDEWIDQEQADSNTIATMELMNEAFNQHGIYFIHPGSPCSPPVANLISTTLMGTETIRYAVPGAKHHDGIDFYVFNSRDDTRSYAFTIPNTYLSIRGQENGKLATETTEAIHGMGHLLGLLHPFEDNCNLTTSCPGGMDLCNCSEDYVCDTPPATHEDLPCGFSLLPSNYMSSTRPISCRTQFTPEQALRMRAYLAGHDSLERVILPEIDFPLTGPGDGLSGNILVSSGELHITTTLEMLPGAYIWVKTGATLRVSTKITGSCGKMWRGIIVQGNTQFPQSPPKHGKVVVDNNGVIEHAVCGIEAQVAGVDGIPSAAANALVPLSRRSEFLPMPPVSGQVECAASKAYLMVSGQAELFPAARPSY